MLTLPDAWVWDSWYWDDGEQFHAFYLKASRALLDPERRHHRPSVGHAVSSDLEHWTPVADALVCADAPAFDDQGIWTGSIVRGDDARYHLFYTGIDRPTLSRIQRIGHAVSDDLLAWTRLSADPVVVADPSWYETDATAGRENWRDPWVFRDGDGWRMLVTAQSATGDLGQRGCIATAWSADLLAWTVEPPLAEHVGLHQLEVLQTLEVDGRWVVAYCLTGRDVHTPGMPQVTGTWTAPADGPGGPFHLERAEPIAVDGNYAGRIVVDRSGTLNLMAFIDFSQRHDLGGSLGNPVPLELTPQGTLQPTMAGATERFRGQAAAS